jgi:hypothetical protein
MDPAGGVAPPEPCDFSTIASFLSPPVCNHYPDDPPRDT